MAEDITNDDEPVAVRYVLWRVLVLWLLGRFSPPQPAVTTDVAASGPRLEEVIYDAARAALTDQVEVVTGIRQRTGTLLAAHALVASFLGATTVKAQGLHGFYSWAAVVVLVAGLVIAAVLLSNWKLEFAVDARQLYEALYQQAADDAPTDSLRWLVTGAYGYQGLRANNDKRVRRMGRLLTLLGGLMVAQTLLWLVALGLGGHHQAASSSTPRTVTVTLPAARSITTPTIP